MLYGKLTDTAANSLAMTIDPDRMLFERSTARSEDLKADTTGHITLSFRPIGSKT